MKRWMAGALALGLCLAVGCAFGTRKPVLTYEPVTPASPAKGVRLQVQPFGDERFDKDLVGHMRNGYGMKTAKVITETNIAEWVTNALKAELTNAGYEVVEGEAGASVAGEVLTVYCDAFMMYEGKVELSVVVRRGEEVVLQEKYRGTHQDVNIAGTAKSFGLTLQRALQNAMRDVVRDLDKKLGVQIETAQVSS